MRISALFDPEIVPPHAVLMGGLLIAVLAFGCSFEFRYKSEPSSKPPADPFPFTAEDQGGR